MNFQDAEEQIENSDAPEPKFFKYYFDFLLNKYGRLSVLVFWLGVILVGVFYGRTLLDQTVFTFSAPSGTTGYTADKKFGEAFKTIRDEQSLLIYYHCPSCNSSYPIFELGASSSSVSYWSNSSFSTTSSQAILYEMSSQLNQSLWDYDKDHDGIFVSYQDYYTAMYEADHSSLITKGFQSFALLEFFNSDNSSMLGIIKYDKNLDHTEESNMLTWLNNKVKSISHSYDGISVKMTGESALVTDMSAESKEDVEKKDIITIPVALSVLGLIVRSWRLMCIPIICVFTSLMASFSIMCPIATHVLDTSPFAPSIMMSVTVAMSIDYSLFLLTRFREEIEKRHKKITSISYLKNVEIAQDSIRQMTRWSGKVVALSGTILSLTYFALVAYPMNMLQSVGLGAGIAIVCTIIVNLTLTPALLLTFPNFFSSFGCSCRTRGNDKDPFLQVQEREVSVNSNNGGQVADYHEYHENGRVDARNGHSNDNNAMTNPLDSVAVSDSPNGLNETTNGGGGGGLRELPSELMDNINSTICDRFWYRCGFITTLFPWSLIIIIVVYGLISPIGWRVTEMKKQLDDTLIFPRDSQYFKTYVDVEDDFSAGLLAPFYLMIPADSKTDNKSVYSEHYFDTTAAMMTQLWENVTNQDYGITLAGISALNNESITYKQWSYANKLFKYNYITSSMVNEDKTASYFSITTDFDPYYDDAFEFLKELRGTMNSICDANGYTCYLTGGSVAEVDTVDKIFDSFPIVLIIIICIIFSLMGIFFYSVFVPIRLFLTITVPMTLVYGLAILTYQFGLFKWLHWSAVSDTDGLYWLVPVMTVTILVGLALDYDIFLFARIYEYRVIVGLNTREAIVRGVYNTGSIITAAGCIMAIAFSGLLMSEMGSLNQTGFILVVAVLVDTFVIRTMLVPAVLSMAKEVNWWPGLRESNKYQPGARRSTTNPHVPLDQTM